MTSKTLMPKFVDEETGYAGSNDRHAQTDIPQMKQKCVGTRQSMFAVYQDQLQGKMKSNDELIVELGSIMDFLISITDSIT